MYSLHLEREIASSHQLTYHDGKCQNLHGHNFLITVDIESTALIEGGSSDGMIVDFGTVKRVIDQFDHKHLNHSFSLDNPAHNQPTAERLAKHIAYEIYEQAKNISISTIKVQVQEATGQSVAYMLERRK